jgi:hypothetical protein
MATINDIINSKYNTVDRYGDITAIWCEDGQQHTDIIKVSKIGRDYNYKKVAAAYEQLINNAPEANRSIIRNMVNQFMADQFTDEAYRLSVVSALDPKSLALNLKPYMSK